VRSMCELLALSASSAVDVRLSLHELARHGGETGIHADGWGAAFLQDRDVALFREPTAAARSPWITCLETHPLHAMCPSPVQRPPARAQRRARERSARACTPRRRPLQAVLFFGDEPTGVDAIVFGALATTVLTPIESPIRDFLSLEPAQA